VYKPPSKYHQVTTNGSTACNSIPYALGLTTWLRVLSVTVGMETEMLVVLRYAQRAIYTRGDPKP